MVKIRETEDLLFWMFVVEMIHIGPDGYVPGLYGYDVETDKLRPPYQDLPVPEHGHVLLYPDTGGLYPEGNTVRFFGEGTGIPEAEDWDQAEAEAWDFYWAVLADPYAMISRCRYCFPYGHRYLTIGP